MDGVVRDFATTLGKTFELGEIVHGPGRLFFMVWKLFSMIISLVKYIVVRK